MRSPFACLAAEFSAAMPSGAAPRVCSSRWRDVGVPVGGRDNMLLDDVALYSVTPSWQADKQSRLLLDFVGPDSVVRVLCACPSPAPPLPSLRLTLGGVGHRSRTAAPVSAAT